MPREKRPSAWSLAAKQAQQQSGKTEEPQEERTRERETDKEEEPQSIETGKQQQGNLVQPQSVETEISQNSIMVQLQSDNTGIEQNGEASTRGGSTTAQPQNSKTALYDQKITLYLSWEQLDKLDMMVVAYKHRTRKRTDPNKLMRMMIDKYTLDDLLS